MKSSWKLPESLRITPFLHFLDCKLPDSRGKLSSMAHPDLGNRPYRGGNQGNSQGLACYPPRPGDAGLPVPGAGKRPPRHWSKSVLSVARKGGGFAVKLWDKGVEPPGLALALLYWHSWRERLDRPEQSRLQRKAWAFSDLLFPNSKGKTLKKSGPCMMPSRGSASRARVG